MSSLHLRTIEKESEKRVRCFLGSELFLKLLADADLLLVLRITDLGLILFSVNPNKLDSLFVWWLLVLIVDGILETILSLIYM